jgi:hypothetical protein
MLLVCILLPVVDLADTRDTGGTDTGSAAVGIMLCVGAARVAESGVRADSTLLQTAVLM